MERIQKIIANSGYCSRRKAEQLIIDGKVKVNGVIVKTLGTKASKNDQILVEGNVLPNIEKLYFVMNKPRYTISSVSDDKNRPTVISILPEVYQNLGLYPVGRLDYDTKGVLLLTNDGEFMNELVGPKSNLEKVYLARIDGVFSKINLANLKSGVMLDGVKTRKCYAKIEEIDKKNQSSLVKIALSEGKYHQVKRMFLAVGFTVKNLTRIKFGEITTDGLKEGEFRELTPHEIKRLYVLSKKTTI
ncbi:MAG: pseudouridine synthase [Bacilli bacterium]|nr:pseudouridine synthase [Bacilli bacterium]MDD2681665.1 pseudouridine synthase [Bacilli bacterium]MDD3121466.1 pseudouridine synthase [Bacilli bacterium]MDD4482005.1 pseudouridine synthase [Bacilli bacterium]